MTDFKFPVKIKWYNDTDSWWNEAVVKVVSVFGLPGHRFMFRPLNDCISFDFENEKDQKLCEILLSERL